MKTTTDRYQQWFVGIILTSAGIVVAIPFIWMIFSSFKTESQVSSLIPTLFPKEFTLDNFQNLFENMNFGLYLRNTVIIVICSFAGLFLNAMAGYAFAKI